MVENNRLPDTPWHVGYAKKHWERIVEHIHEIYPIATDKQIRKVLK